MPTFSELIKGLQIFKAAGGDQWLGGAEHDVIYVSTLQPDKLSEGQRQELEDAGFNWDEYHEHWYIFT